MKILEENIGSNFFDISHRSLIPDVSPQAREGKEKNKLLGLYQIFNIFLL